MDATVRAYSLHVQTGGGLPVRATGLAAGFAVEVSVDGKVSVDAEGTMPDGFILEPWGAQPPSTRAGGIPTGDAAFDQGFHLGGDAALVLALVTPHLRRQVVTHRPVVRSGEIVVRGTDVLAALRFAVSLAEALQPPKDLGARLADNLGDCQSTWERLAILRVLAGRFPRHPAAQPVLLEALSDPNEEVRLVVAPCLGEQGHEALRKIAERDEGDETRPARALRALGAALSTERVEHLLVEALRRRRHLVAEAAIEALATRHDKTSTGRLTAVLAHGNETLCLAAARALAVRGEDAAEPALVAALADSRWSVAAEAAEALGAVGTAAAVLPLRRAAESGQTGVRRAARQAIAQIQSRLPGADRGQLSLPDAAAGDVSLADEAPRGQVSLVPRADPRPDSTPKPS